MEPIVKFVHRNSQPLAKKASDCVKLRDKVSQNKLNFVYFGDFQGPTFDIFVEVAEKQQIYHSFYAPITCTGVLGAQPDSLNIYRQFDDPHLMFFTNKAPTVDSVLKWLAVNSKPFVLEFSAEYTEMLFSEKEPVSFLVLFNNKKEDQDEFENQVEVEYRAIA